MGNTKKQRKTYRTGGNTKKKHPKVSRKGSNTKNKEKTSRKGGNTKTKEKLTKKLRKAYKNKANLLSLIAEKIMYVYHAFRTFINYLICVSLG